MKQVYQTWKKPIWLLTAFAALVALVVALTLIGSAQPVTTVTVNGVEYPLWDGESFSASFEGSGTEEDPYLISSGNDLALLSYISNNIAENCEMDGVDSALCDAITTAGGFYNWTKGKVFRLTRDIWLNDTTSGSLNTDTAHPFPMIGDRNNGNGDKNGHSVGQYKFCGTLDGAGYAIHGFKLTNSDNESMVGMVSWDYGAGVSLFQFLSGEGTIKNLGMLECFVKGKVRTAPFVGTMQAGTTIDNCYTDCECELGGNYGQIKVLGGIVGHAEGGTVRNCVFAGTMKLGNATDNARYVPQYCGGIIGNATNSGDVLVENCVVYGTMKKSFSTSVTASILFSSSDWTGARTLTVKNCYAVKGSGADVLTGVINTGAGVDLIENASPKTDGIWSIEAVSFAGLADKLPLLGDKFVSATGNPLFGAMLASFADRITPTIGVKALNLIQPVGYQIPTDATAESESVDVRLLFLIRSSDYTDAGFFVSLSNANPTAGGENVTKKSVTSVWKTVHAGNETLTAPDGYFYAVVKITGVPKSAFGTPINVNAFVENGEGNYVYTGALTLTLSSVLH